MYRFYINSSGARLGMNYYIYIVECSDGSLYTGFTTDIQNRINHHNNSKKLGAKSLRGKLPVHLVYNERFETKIDALKREREIKGWKRKKKIELIALALRSEATKRA